MDKQQEEYPEINSINISNDAKEQSVKEETQKTKEREYTHSSLQRALDSSRKETGNVQPYTGSNSGDGVTGAVNAFSTLFSEFYKSNQDKKELALKTELAVQENRRAQDKNKREQEIHEANKRAAILKSIQPAPKTPKAATDEANKGTPKEDEIPVGLEAMVRRERYRGLVEDEGYDKSAYFSGNGTNLASGVIHGRITAVRLVEQALTDQFGQSVKIKPKASTVDPTKISRDPGFNAEFEMKLYNDDGTLADVQTVTSLELIDLTKKTLRQAQFSTDEIDNAVQGSSPDDSDSKMIHELKKAGKTNAEIQRKINVKSVKDRANDVPLEYGNRKSRILPTTENEDIDRASGHPNTKRALLEKEDTDDTLASAMQKVSGKLDGDQVGEFAKVNGKDRFIYKTEFGETTHIDAKDVQVIDTKDVRVQLGRAHQGFWRKNIVNPIANAAGFFTDQYNPYDNRARTVEEAIKMSSDTSWLHSWNKGSPYAKQLENVAEAEYKEYAHWYVPTDPNIIRVADKNKPGDFMYVRINKKKKKG